MQFYYFPSIHQMYVRPGPAIGFFHFLPDANDIVKNKLIPSLYSCLTILLNAHLESSTVPLDFYSLTLFHNTLINHTAVEFFPSNQNLRTPPACLFPAQTLPSQHHDSHPSNPQPSTRFRAQIHYTKRFCLGTSALHTTDPRHNIPCPRNQDVVLLIPYSQTNQA